MFKYRDHEVSYIANRGWITRDPDGEVTHEGLLSLEAAVDQIIHDTKPPALEIVRKLREVAQIETGLLYSRRNMLIDAATTIEALTKPATAYEYRIETKYVSVHPEPWGKGDWRQEYALFGSTEEEARERFSNYVDAQAPENRQWFRLTRRPVNDWSVME